MTSSIFNPIYSLSCHPNEKFAFLRSSNAIFNFGQKAYEIKPYAGNSKLELAEIKGSSPSLLGIIVRIVSYMTIIIPLIMLIGTLIYNAVNKFQMGTDEDIFQKSDVGKCITPYLTIKDLLSLRMTSVHNKATIVTELVDRLNSYKICPVISVTSLINSLGEHASKVTTLDLRSISELDDQNLEKIFQFFPKLKHLFLKKNQITDESAQSLSKMDCLEKLDLSGCENITHVNFLQDLEKLTSLNLSGCTSIIDFSVFNKLQGLKELQLQDCIQVRDFSFLLNFPQLVSLNLSRCHFNISCMQNLQNLANLNISGCIHITPTDLLKLSPRLLSLDISQNFVLFDLSFLLHFKEIREVNLSGRGMSFDGNILNPLKELPFLTKLNLSKNHLSNTMDFQGLQRLKELDLSGSYDLTDISCLQELKGLEKLNLSNCRIKDISTLQELKFLRELDISWSTPEKDILQRIERLEYFKKKAS